MHASPVGKGAVVALLLALLPLSSYAGPCDIYAAAGTPCVGAFSLLRALFASYSGPLYTVRRASDNTTRAIPLRTVGGFVDASVQETFCAGTDCAVWRLVDQSLYNNDLTVAPPGGSARHVDNGVNASALPVTLPDGTRAYGAHFEQGANQGYRIDITNSVARGNEPETIYMVTSGDAYNHDCCYDFGNAESNNLDTGEGSMECVYYGALNQRYGCGAQALPTRDVYCASLLSPPPFPLLFSSGSYNATGKGWCGGVGSGPWVMVRARQLHARPR